MDPELSSVLGSQLNQFDLRALDLPDTPSFAELVGQAINGQLDLSLQGVSHAGIHLFVNELVLNAHLIRQLLIIAILGALLRCLNDAFKHKAAGELGFYVTYIMAVLLAFSSFNLATGILTDLLSSLSGMMDASIPLIISLMAASGNVVSAAAFHPILIFAVSLITRFITDVFIPLLLAAMGLAIVNQLTDNNMLGKFTSLIKKVADLTLKGLVFVFVLLLTLQRISLPTVNNLALKTAKAAAGAVPVVGGALNTAVDTVLLYAAAARSGVLVALIIVICLAVAAPLIKMLALMFTFKLVAAMTQPVCDERVSDCLDQLGSFTAMLTGAGAITAVMFICVAVILLSF